MKLHGVKHSRPRGHGASEQMHSFPSFPSHELPSPSRELPSSLPCGPANAVCCPHGCSKKIKNILFFFCFGSCCQLEKREKKFRFPSSTSSPSSAGFAGEAARRRFFRPSSPSHPSKLYSSLGLLNSKVPKPFSPFSLRLIDVDGF
jgi:hypothetical protein